MKAYLEFDLYEDQGSFDDARNGTAYRAVLQQLDDWLKRWYEGQEDRNHNTVSLTIDETRCHLAELLEAKGVTLWD